METKIKEMVKTDCGKLKYVIELQQGKDNKLQLYIDSSNKIHFESNDRYYKEYPVFDIKSEAHKVAKEIFLTYLQAYVKSQILELKQLELVLDILGLKEVIRSTIIDNSSMLLETKNEIIKQSIEHTESIISDGVEKAILVAEEKAVEVIDEVVRPIAKKRKPVKTIDEAIAETKSKS